MGFWKIYSFFYRLAINSFLPYQDLLKDVIDFVKVEERERILDAGCGPGVFIKRILKENKEKNIKAIGIDGSSEMISYAKRRCPNSIELKVEDLNKKLSFSDNFFDKIVCINVLYALSHPNQTIQEFYRILKPGGFLILTNPKPTAKGKALWQAQLKAIRKLTPFSEKLRYIFLFFITAPILPVVALFNRKILEKGRKGEYHFLNKEELKKLLEKFNFKNIKIISTYVNQNWLVKAKKR